MHYFLPHQLNIVNEPIENNFAPILKCLCLTVNIYTINIRLTETLISIIQSLKGVYFS